MAELQICTNRCNIQLKKNLFPLTTANALLPVLKVRPLLS